MEFSQTIGSSIKERRKSLGLGQNDLAELSKVSLHTIVKIERGQGNPTISILHRVLEVLGMELSVNMKSV